MLFSSLKGGLMNYTIRPYGENFIVVEMRSSGEESYLGDNGRWTDQPLETRMFPTRKNAAFHLHRAL